MIPDRAEIVVVGAGIAGSSIALHLAKLGREDVVVLEQGELVSGTTSHAPGLVGQLRSTKALVEVLTDSVALYRKLSQSEKAGYQDVGSLRLASSKERLAELQRQLTFAKSCGLEASIIGPRETAERFPLIDVKGVEGALFFPTDGSATATVLAQAMIHEAKDRGVFFFPQTRVEAIELEGQAIRAVETSQGRIETETLVVACGVWSPRVARLAGVEVPMVPLQHQYVVTCPLDELPDEMLPNLRDPDNLVYLRQRDDTLVIGGYEHAARSFPVESIPERRDPTVQTFDRQQFDQVWQGAVRRIPCLRTATFTREVNGIESFTPDGEFIVGPAPGVRGMWLACGFCAHGVSGSGGIGKSLAAWIVEGKPLRDLSTMDPARFGAKAADRDFVEQRAKAIYGAYYGLRPAT